MRCAPALPALSSSDSLASGFGVEVLGLGLFWGWAFGVGSRGFWPRMGRRFGFRKSLVFGLGCSRVSSPPHPNQTPLKPPTYQHPHPQDTPQPSPNLFDKAGPFGSLPSAFPQVLPKARILSRGAGTLAPGVPAGGPSPSTRLLSRCFGRFGRSCLEV